MKVLLVAGARPNFMKVAPIIRALGAKGHQAMLVHTGQHYDSQMSDAFFADLGLQAPQFHLGVGSGTHAQQTARVMEAFEPVLLSSSPDWVVVVGDVNSTLASALVVSKLRHQLRCRLAHVEAGLRSHDWRMPEEVNRVLTDRLSDLLLTPSEDALPNLLAEGIAARNVVFVGNVMIDTLLAHRESARSLAVADRLGLTHKGYILATLHRPSNVDDVRSLRSIIDAFGSLAEHLPVVFPVHPRILKNAVDYGLGQSMDKLMVIEPLGYLDMLSLSDASALVVTDSGGLQEETTVLGVPCLTLREQTERPITVAEGTNRLARWPLTREGIVEMALDALAGPLLERRPAGWDGHASDRIVSALESASA